MNALTSMIFTILLATVSSGMMDVVANDSCHYSNDGICDEPPLEGGCAVGTDMNDCIGERYYPCQYINDGVCDEGPDHQYCLPGTDTNDCCENGMLKTWNETDINFGRDLSDAICEGFILDYRRMMATTPIQEEITPMTCSGVLECSTILQDEKSNEVNKETKDQFLSSLFFQFIFVYCSCIYYQRIIDGLEFIRDNIGIILKIWCNIIKCIIYLFLLALSIGIVVSAIGDQEKEKEMTLLKIMGLVAFLDYVDERENNRVEDEGEDEVYRRWRRRRERHNAVPLDRL